MTSPDTEDLFEKHQAGCLSPEEKRFLADRLEADPVFQKELVDYFQWSAMLARGLSQRQEADAGDRGSTTTRRRRATRRFRRPRAFHPGFWAVAAAVLVMSLAAYHYLNVPRAPRATLPGPSPVVQAPLVPAPPVPDVPLPATLAVIEGESRDARIVRGPETRLLADGEALVAGDRIETGSDGEADVRYADDATHLYVGPDSSVTMQQTAGAKRVYLNAGRVAASVAKQPEGRPMTFLMPHAKATVLGTRLTLTVDRESSRLDVSEGRVGIAKGADPSVVVGAGEYAVASDWEALRVRKVEAAKHGLSEKLVPGAGCLWGISLKAPPTITGTLQAMEAFESKIGRKVAIAQQYLAFSDTGGAREFPNAAATSWSDGGRRVLLSWKPRVGSTLPKWADVAAGRYDATYVDPTARKLAAWGRPCFFALHHQPDDDIGPEGSGMTAADFVAMWRHVRARFDDAGASNAVWVWTVVSGTTDASVWDALYPGDAVVDWLAGGTFNFQPGRWRSLTESTQAFRSWVGRSFPGDREKPVMLCVVACAEKADDPAAKEAWFRALPAVLASMPVVKGIVYWNGETTAGSYAVDSSPAALDGYRAAGLDPYVNPD